MAEETTSTNKLTLRKARYSLMGQIIGDQYIVIDVIGEGELTIVYMAQSTESRETVAIKTLKYENPELIEKFNEEIEKYRQIKHPSIVEIIDIYESEANLPVVVMEYVEGVTLRQLLESLERIDEENTLLSVLSGVCDSLEYVHSKGLFHGGLNPNQILISENEVADDFTVKVTDFGTASLINEFELPQSDSRITSYSSFLSPEQKANEYVAVNTDIFSLGAITYLMVSGKNPLASKKLSTLVAGGSKDGPSFTPLTHLALELPCLTELNQLLEQALESDPDWRMPSVSQFKKDLTDWHQKALAEDFDEIEEGLDSLNDFDAISDTEFEIEEEVSETTSAKVEGEAQVAQEPVAPRLEPIREEEPGINDEITKTGQSKVISFEAVPSYYEELYSKEEAPPEEEKKEEDGAEKPVDPDKVILEEQVLKAVEEPPKKKKRRRRRSRSTQQNVRTTIRNLVSLRENQINQEETIAMQFAGKFSAKGPRRSPKDTAIRLGGACLITAVLTGLVMANLDSLQELYRQSSLTLGSIITTEEEEEEVVVEEPVGEKDQSEEELKTKKVKKPVLRLKIPLISSAKKRHKLNKLEKQTPLASEFYRNWRHSAYSNKAVNNSKVGNRRRIDYREFDENWLK